MDIDITPLIEMSLAGAKERGYDKGYNAAVSEMMRRIDYLRRNGAVFTMRNGRESEEVISFKPLINELMDMREGE